MASLKIFVHYSLELMWHKHPWLDTWTIDLIKVDFLLWPKSKLSDLLLAECEFFQRRIKGNRSLYLGHLEQAMSKAQYAICLATLCLILVLDGSYTLVCYRRQNWQNSYFPHLWFTGRYRGGSWKGQNNPTKGHFWRKPKSSTVVASSLFFPHNSDVLFTIFSRLGWNLAFGFWDKSSVYWSWWLSTKRVRFTENSRDWWKLASLLLPTFASPQTQLHIVVNVFFRNFYHVISNFYFNPLGNSSSPN